MKRSTTFILSLGFAIHCFASIEAKLVYEKPINSADLAVHADLQKSGTVESMVEFINRHFILSESLRFLIGGDDGPLFDLANK